MIRLQGAEWRREMPNLELVSYIESLHGNICIYLKKKGTKKPIFSHWLNDTEKEKFNTCKENIPKHVWPEKKSKEKTNVDKTKDQTCYSREYATDG